MRRLKQRLEASPFSAASPRAGAAEASRPHLHSLFRRFVQRHPRRNPCAASAPQRPAPSLRQMRDLGGARDPRAAGRAWLSALHRRLSLALTPEPCSTLATRISNTARICPELRGLHVRERLGGSDPHSPICMARAVPRARPAWRSSEGRHRRHRTPGASLSFATTAIGGIGPPPRMASPLLSTQTRLLADGVEILAGARKRERLEQSAGR
jgi:hypothetical protein